MITEATQDSISNELLKEFANIYGNDYWKNISDHKTTITNIEYSNEDGVKKWMFIVEPTIDGNIYVEHFINDSKQDPEYLYKYHWYSYDTENNSVSKSGGETKYVVAKYLIEDFANIIEYAKDDDFKNDRNIQIIETDTGYTVTFRGYHDEGTLYFDKNKEIIGGIYEGSNIISIKYDDTKIEIPQAVKDRYNADQDN